MKSLVFFLPIIFFAYYSSAQKSIKLKSNRISIYSEVPLNYTKDKIEFKVIGVVDAGEPTAADSLSIIDGLVVGQLLTDEPLKIKTPLFGKRAFGWPLLEPGDNISITYKNGNIRFSGKGAMKFQLENKITEVNDSLYKTEIYREKLKPVNYKLGSLSDYMLWNSFLNEKKKLITAILEDYKSKISLYAYNKIKVDVLSEIENTRVEKFGLLMGKVNPSDNADEIVNKYGLSNKDLISIYDSTLNNNDAQWLMYQAPLVNSLSYIRHRITIDAFREKKLFFKEHESDSSALGKSPAAKYEFCYRFAQRKYSGIVREAYLASIFLNVRGAFHKPGFTPEIEALLADYYAQSQYPDYKKLVKQTEIKYRERYNRNKAADFKLTGTRDDFYTKDKIKNKIAVLDFWFTGCKGCIQMAPALKRVEDHFKGDTNVVFLSISIDKTRERWIKSIGEKKYTSGTAINVYTGGLGKNHEMIKKYGVTGYPTIYLIDPFDKVSWSNSIPDPRNDNGKALIGLIEKHLTVLKDGPYVFYNADTINSYTINGTVYTNTKLNKKENPIVKVQTDKFGQEYNVLLKQSVKIAPSEYSRPEKMLVLSDIEGNFEAFRNLLQSNKVIDENFNWIYGNGHLVFAGDMFDRGNQVTECLWLLYSLEAKAEEQGGYVHFILGNHELMNLQGDERYAKQKYIDNSSLIKKSLKELYNENSELGRWLRTKNIIEKIGDLLILHGGVSRDINQLPVTIAEINEFAKPFYAVVNKDYKDERVKIIMNNATAPFWYRGYYVRNIPESIIDSTLQKFNVKHIITGHTIVADTISTHFNCKIINTDTHHAAGKSEALLIEGQNFYRVNSEGEKALLFTSTNSQIPVYSSKE